MDLAHGISREASNFVQKIGAHLNEEQWELITKAIIVCYEHTEPR